jgi:hypothetical protein
MRLLSDVLLFPVTGPVRGFRAILEAIQAEVEAQMQDEQRVQGALVELELRHDTGQIDDAEYEAEQTRLMQELNEVRASKEQAMEAQTTGTGALRDRSP